jgi:hypothetical protein
MYSREWMAKMRRREARKKKRALAVSVNGKKKPSDYGVPAIGLQNVKDENESAG